MHMDRVTNPETSTNTPTLPSKKCVTKPVKKKLPQKPALLEAWLKPKTNPQPNLPTQTLPTQPNPSYTNQMLPEQELIVTNVANAPGKKTPVRSKLMRGGGGGRREENKTV